MKKVITIEIETDMSDTDIEDDVYGVIGCKHDITKLIVSETNIEELKEGIECVIEDYQGIGDNEGVNRLLTYLNGVTK